MTNLSANGGVGRVRLAGVAAAWFAAAWAACAAPIRNVILFIGDGMGPEQVAAARCYAGAPLAFEAFPHQTRIGTVSVWGAVTDSAAAATALATGRKVYNGVLSLALPGDGGELETLLEVSQKQGKATGLVTTSYLSDATPAAFGAHAASRGNDAQIVSDYLGRTRPEVLLGGVGGMDGEAAAAAGYTVVADAAALSAAVAAGAPRVCGLFGDYTLPYEYDGLQGAPGLAEMAARALAVLGRDPDGFFLMVEGGRIDHACHGNELERCVFEVLAFDAAVRQVSAWAQGREDTLVVVTADHETGGLSVVADNGVGLLPSVTWSTSGHTSTPVPLYAWGANAVRAALLSDNTGVREVALSDALMPAVGVGVEREASGVALTRWAVSPGDSYRLERSSTLALPQWTPCAVITAEESRVEIPWPSGGGASGFFRLVAIETAAQRLGHE